MRNPSLLSTAGNEQLGRDRGLQTIYVHTADHYYYYYYLVVVVVVTTTIQAPLSREGGKIVGFSALLQY